MATTTLGLTQLDGTEFVNFKEVINGDNAKIDSAISALQASTGGSAPIDLASGSGSTIAKPQFSALHVVKSGYEVHVYGTITKTDLTSGELASGLPAPMFAMDGIEMTGDGMLFCMASLSLTGVLSVGHDVTTNGKLYVNFTYFTNS